MTAPSGLDSKWEIVDGPKHFLALKDAFNNADDGADLWFDQQAGETFADSFLTSPSQTTATTSSESKPVEQDEEFPTNRETFVVQKSILGYSPRPQPLARKPVRKGSPELNETTVEVKQETVSEKKRETQEEPTEPSPVPNVKSEVKSPVTEKAIKPALSKAVPVIKHRSTFKPQHKTISQRSAALKAAGTITSILSPKKNPAKKQKITTSDVKKTANTSKLAEEKKPSLTQKKTYEELQVEEIKRLQTESRKRLRANRRSYAKMSKATPVVTVKGSMPTTEPMEFKFHQTNREKKGIVVKGGSEGVSEQHFKKSLRSSKRSDNYNPNVPTTKPPTPTGSTKFKPFKFHLDNRLSSKQTPIVDAGPQIPLAEFVAKYEKSTPPRFRRSTASQERNVSRTSQPVPLTYPKAPELATSTRTRPVNVKSSADLEEEELEEIRKHKFKATVPNPAIFEKGGLMGVPKKVKKPLVPPATPELATKKRFQERVEKDTVDQEEKENSTFHAKPMPDFSKITGLPPKLELHLTAPESPAFSLKRRRDDSDASLNESKKPKTDEPKFEFKATAVPNLENAFKPKLEERVYTVAKPFSFEDRDKDKPSRQSFVEMILNKEKPAPFKANALPDMSEPSGLPEKVVQPSTKPEPFHLLSDTRREEYNKKLKEKHQLEVADENSRNHFTASDASVLYEKPFIPHPSNKPVTHPDGFKLHSQVRSEKRAQFEDHLRAESQRKEEESLRRKTLREIQEKRELSKYRKSLVHKALPIKNYGKVVFQPNEIPPTIPISPHFHTDSRLRK